MVKILLVIDYNYSRDWSSIFGGIKLSNGEEIRVEQTSWKDLIVQSSSDEGCVVKLLEKSDPILKQQKRDRTFTPDFLLIRNFHADLHGDDFKNTLYALMFSGLPAVNSLQSVYFCSQKPIVYGELQKIKKKFGGFEKFPLIPQTYYCNLPSSHTDLIQEKKFPVVSKIGTVHAGYGKMLLKSASEFKDYQSCMMLTKDYYITEPFLDVDYDLRLQKIGDTYRVYIRSSESTWKQNWGEVKYKIVEEYPEHYTLWMDEVSKIFGGVDMFALDVLKLKDGKEIILELNDSAMGLMFAYEREDNNRIKDLVVKRMNEEFCSPEREEEGEVN